MRYTNKKHGFSFEIPGGWTKTHRSWLLWLAQGQVSIIPEKGDANINVSCRRIQRDLNDIQRRALALQQFLESKGYAVIQVGVGDTELAGEKNTVDAVCEDPQDPPGYRAAKISAVHKGMECLTTFGGDYEKHRGSSRNCNAFF